MDAHALFAQGRDAFDRGDFSSAARFYEASAGAGGGATAWIMAGLALSIAGRNEEALSKADAGLKAEAGDAALWSLRAYVLNLLKRHREALESADRSVALDPRQADGWNNRGIALQCLGTLEKKLDLLREAMLSFGRSLEINPKHPRAGENRERVAAQIRAVEELEAKVPVTAGDWVRRSGNHAGEEALRCLERALELEPGNLEALFAKAALLLQARAFGEGGRALDEFLAASGSAENERSLIARQMIEALRRDGVYWRGDGPPGLERTAMNRAAELSNAAESDLREGRFAAGAEKALEAARLNPACGSAWMNAGYALDELDRSGEALACYDKGLALLPQEAAGWLNRGAALGKLKRPEEAEASYAKGCELDGKRKDAWRTLARMRADLKRWDDALAAFERGLSFFPNDYDLLWERVKLLEEAGRKKESMAAFEEAARDPAFAARWDAEGDRLFGAFSSGADPLAAPAAPSGPGDSPDVAARREAAVASGGHEARPEAAPPAAAPVDGAQFKPGDVIGGKYEVVSVLGIGGMGVVYKVYSRESKSVYALKTFREELLADAKAREMFKQEAQVWLDLGRHPYLARAYFFDELHGRFYLAVELVAPPDAEPSTLQGWVERAPVPAGRLLRWAVQFCLGMEHAGARGVRAHKDIKPANVLVAADGSLRISDFGLAGLAAGAASAESGIFATGLALTVAGGEGGAGTPPYMPPEQWRSIKACDARSDVYAFGVTLYQLATGRLPLLPDPPRGAGDMNRFLLEMRALHEGAEPPPLDGPLGPIVARCLMKDPARRWQGFADLRAALEPLLLAETGETVTVPQPKAVEAWELNNRGISLNDLGRFDEAIDCFDRALALDPANARTMSNRSLALNGSGRHREALDWAEKALAADPEELTAWNNKGCALLDLGEWVAAEQAFEQVLRRNPRHLDALNNVGYSLIGRKSLTEAVAAFDRALAVEPRSPTAWNNKGAALDKLGQAEAAMACYEKSLSLDPFQFMAWMNTGIILRRAKRVGEALARYAKAIELKADYAPVWFNKAVAEEELARYGDALASFRKFMALGGGGPSLAEQQAFAKNRIPDLEKRLSAPPSPAAPRPAGASPADAHLERADRHLKAGRLAEALPDLENAVRADPAKWPAWANLAMVLSALKRPADALQAAERAASLAPDRDGPWMIKAGILAEAGRLEEALACYDRALAIEPRVSPTWNNKAALLNRLRRPDEALACLARALEADKDNFTAWLNRAHTERELGRAQEAARSYREFLRCAPAQYAAQIAEAREAIAALESGGAPASEEQVKEWQDAAQILLNQGQLPRALVSVDRALAARPALGPAWLLKSDILARLGRAEEALRSCDEAARLLPARQDVLIRRAELQSALGRHDQAAAAFEAALRIDPKSAGAHNGLGAALFALKRVDEALACFDRALALDSLHPLARYNRSVLLESLGRREEAIIGYRQFLNSAPIQYKAFADKVRERLRALE